MPESIRSAKSLWIEAGSLSGELRNQLEFSDELVQFFDDESRSRKKVLIRCPDGLDRERPLAHRGTKHHYTDIWRLGLPTPDMGAPNYQGRVVRIDRIRVRDKVAYEVTVEDTDSDKAQQWRERAGREGVTGT